MKQLLRSALVVALLTGCGSPTPVNNEVASDLAEASASAPKFKPTKAKKAVDGAILRAASSDPLSYATLYGLEFTPTDRPIVYTFKLKAIVKTSKETLTFSEVTGLYSTKTDTVPKLTLGEVVRKPR